MRDPFLAKGHIGRGHVEVELIMISAMKVGERVFATYLRRVWFIPHPPSTFRKFLRDPLSSSSSRRPSIFPPSLQLVRACQAGYNYVVIYRNIHCQQPQKQRSCILFNFRENFRHCFLSTLTSSKALLQVSFFSLRGMCTISSSMYGARVVHLKPAWESTWAD